VAQKFDRNTDASAHDLFAAQSLQSVGFGSATSVLTRFTMRLGVALARA
jgi:hypothetical protein